MSKLGLSGECPRWCSKSLHFKKYMYHTKTDLRFWPADCPTIPILSGLSRFCLKIPNPDLYAIGIGKIPISTGVVIFS